MRGVAERFFIIFLVGASLLFVLFSCGRTHNQSGIQAGVGAPLAAPIHGRASTAPTIPLSDVLAQIDAYPAPKGVSVTRWATLTSELKKQIIARSKDGKTLSVAPTGAENEISDLTAVSNEAVTQATVTWTEKLWGDYNNDGSVDIADLGPLAEYYGQRTDTGANDAHKLIVGDGDPEINISDLGPIASDYAAHIEGYQVWRGHFNGTTTDWESTPLPNTNPANPYWTIDRPAPPASSRPSLSFVDDISGLADKVNTRYGVIECGDGEMGAQSNEALLNPPPAWPKFHGNPASTGLSPYIGAQTNTVKWTFATGGAIESSPAVAADGTVYVGSDDHNVYALSPLDGSVRWVFTTGDLVECSPAIGAEGTLYVGSWDHDVYALNPNGTIKWQYATGDIVHSSPVVGADGTVYVGSYDGNVYAFSPDGTVKWQYATGNQVYSSPAIGADGTVYVGSTDYSVYALNSSDGSLKWSYATGGPVYSSPAVSADGTLYVGDTDTKVYALSSADGSVKWTYTTGNLIRCSPAVGADGTVYVGSNDHFVYALNPADGSVKWSYDTGDQVLSSPAIGADGTVYAASWNGILSALDSVGGSVKWTYSSGGWFVYSSPAIAANGTIYIGNDDNNVYAFGP